MSLIVERRGDEVWIRVGFYFGKGMNAKCFEEVGVVRWGYELSEWSEEIIRVGSFEFIKKSFKKGLDT